MSDKKIQKHVYLTPENVHVLDDVIKNKLGINTYSEAIRYIIDVYSNQLAEEDSKVNQRKINAMSKNVDILVELVAGGLQSLDVHAIRKSEETDIYKDAKKFVEEKIQRAVTLKSNPKKSNWKENNEVKKQEEPERQTNPTGRYSRHFNF